MPHGRFQMDCNVHFRVSLVPKGLIHGLYPIQSTPTRLRPPRCAAALAWILQSAINDVTQPRIVGSFDRLRNVSQELTPLYPIQYFRYNPRTRL